MLKPFSINILLDFITRFMIYEIIIKLYSLSLLIPEDIMMKNLSAVLAIRM